jgi:4-aminobutyrate aminotransferase-like enzyme
VIEAADSEGRPIGTFIAEAAPGTAGQVVPPPGYLAAAFERAHRAGAVVIADEVQVGLGRVGTHWWGFQVEDAAPDIVTMGKPLGNGHPLGAVATTRAIAAAFANGMEYFNTFGGNPVSCAAALAVLDVIADERLQPHAARLGARIKDGLRGLAERHDAITDVRGEGLFLGVELSDAQRATAVVEHARRAGVLLSTDGPRRNVIKIKPPLVVGDDDAELLLRTLDAALTPFASTA